MSIPTKNPMTDNMGGVAFRPMRGDCKGDRGLRGQYVENEDSLTSFDLSLSGATAVSGQQCETLPVAIAPSFRYSE